MKALYVLSGLFPLTCLNAQVFEADSTLIQDSSTIASVADTTLALTATAPAASQDHFFGQPNYRISIGAAFDFVEQFKPAQIYGDLMIDVPNVIKSKNAHSGIMAGLYQIRFLAVDSFIPDRLFLTAQTEIEKPQGPDSSIVRLSAAEGREDMQLDNLYFFTTLYRPWQTDASSTGHSGLFHLFHLSSIRSSRITTTRFRRTVKDTVFIANSSSYPILPLDSQVRETSTYWEFGFGQMLRHQFDDLALQITLMGLLSPGNGFGYAFRFNAVGTSTGLVVGSEIRTDPLLDEPLYNIYLAKTIKLKDLTNLITSY